MSTPSAKMLVSVGEKFACVKVVGRANFTSSIDLKNLIDELLQKGYAWFVLDLTDCVLMDSTFLGVLAGLGLKLNGAEAEPSARTLELFNPNARILELLENLGVLHLFKIGEGEIKFPDKTELRELTPAQPGRDEVKVTCLEAHKTLMEINPENVSRFKELTQFLAEDLKKLKSVSQ
jgi:anti-anti-sigma regulatory factor